DTNVRVIDYATTTTEAEANTIQRIRDYHINNQTWSLSPFLAFLARPTDRAFCQGFLQFDFPLNSSTITFTERIPRGTVPPPFDLPVPSARPCSRLSRSVMASPINRSFTSISTPATGYSASPPAACPGSRGSPRRWSCTTPRP